MSELVIFPEMIEAGKEEVAECRAMNLGDEQTAINVYMAMAGIFVMAKIRGENERVH